MYSVPHLTPRVECQMLLGHGARPQNDMLAVRRTTTRVFFRALQGGQEPPKTTNHCGNAESVTTLNLSPARCLKGWQRFLKSAIIQALASKHFVPSHLCLGGLLGALIYGGCE